MRLLVAVVLTGFATGCQNCHRFFLGWCEAAPACAPGPGAAAPAHVEGPVVRAPAESPPPQVYQPPPPRVEVRAPEDVRVKLPPQKIVVEAPPAPAPTILQGAGMPQAMPQVVGMHPVAPAYAPLQAMPAAAGFVQAAAPARATPAIGLDWIRIPLPFPRLFAVPAAQEVTVPVAVQQVPYFPQQVQYAPQQIQYMPQQVQYATPQVQYAPPPVQYAPQQVQHVPVAQPAAAQQPSACPPDVAELLKKVEALEKCLQNQGAAAAPQERR